jgi:enoyl-CoA hydratase/carnithine racemase
VHAVAPAMTANDPLLRHEKREGIAVLTLDQPGSRNSLSHAMLDELIAAFAAIGADQAVRAVILAAEGPAFCSGHDLKELTAHRADRDGGRGFFTSTWERCGTMMQSIVRLPQPVIACVQGAAVAAGCQLVASCDLAVASDSARFAVSGVNFGLFCSSPSVALSRNVARKAAFEMLVTGEFISAEEARVKGLVNRVVPGDGLDGAVESLVAAIVAKPRVSIALGKALFYRQIEAGTEAAYEQAARTMAGNMMEPAALEGVQAFIDKRKPSWPA